MLTRAARARAVEGTSSGFDMTSDSPPILEYRTPRPPPLGRSISEWIESAVLFVLGTIALLIGCGYVLGAIYVFATSAKPFPVGAFVLSLLLLFGSIGLGLSALSFRFAWRRRGG
jgi:hypothetical protein